MRAVQFEGLDWEKENERSKRGSEHRKALKQKLQNCVMNSLKIDEELEVVYIWLKGLAEDNGRFYNLCNDNRKGLIFRFHINCILKELGQLHDQDANTIVGAEDLFPSLQIIQELPQEKVMEIQWGDEMSTLFLRAMFIPKKSPEEISSSHTVSSISTSSFGTALPDLFQLAACQVLGIAFGAYYSAKHLVLGKW